MQKDEYWQHTLFAKRKTGQRTTPENISDDKGIFIKSISLLSKDIVVMDFNYPESM